jgi:hypothetical protein
VKRLRFALAILFATALLHEPAGAAARGTLRIDGGYVAVSYDLGRIYAEKAVFKLGALTLRCRTLRLDVASGTGWAAGEVSIEDAVARRTADAVIFDRRASAGLAVRYGETVGFSDLETGKDVEESGAEAWLVRVRALEDLTLAEIRMSLLYATAKTVEIAVNGEVTGYDVMMFVEGIESVGFKKFRILAGEKGPARGFSLDKVWFTKTRGLFGRASFNWDGGKALQTSTVLSYEEHSILKNYTGLSRQFDLQSTTRVAIGGQTGLGLAARDVSYNKPLLVRGETWLGVQSNLDLGPWGRLSVQGRYEVHNQTLAGMNYATTLFKKIQLQVQSNYSRIRTGGAGAESEIFNGGINLSYASKWFQLGTDYALNSDLYRGQLLSRPQLRLSTSPIIFYGGLLTATVQNLFLYNSIKQGTAETSSYSNNTALMISAKPILILPDFRLQANLSLEQFLEKEGRNFTSGGFVLRADRSFGQAVSLEGLYSLQSRRRSNGWLVEGTTSQDVSGVLRVEPFEALRSWLSVSFDPKRGEWRQAFADVSIGLIRQWRFQSLLNYDLARGRLNNVDLSLVRQAGRFDLRFIWRSISKQFLIELLPGR